MSDEHEHIEEEMINVYVSGVLDGLARFGVNVTTDSSQALDYRIQPVIEVRRSDERLISVIENWMREVGLGPTVTDEETKRGYRYILRLQNREDIQKMLAIILPYLAIKHDEAELLAENIIPMLEQKRHLSEEGFVEVMGYVDRLNALSVGESKYSQEYFIEEFGLTDSDLDFPLESETDVPQ